MTYIATCDLFQPLNTVSALSWFAQEVDGDSKCVVGALIERQIKSMEESRWKAPVRDVLCTLVDDALLVYDPEERPIRHTRVLLKRLELGLETDANAIDVVTKLATNAEVILAQKVARYIPHPDVNSS